MTPGCLLVTNNVAASGEAEFNGWYQGEHLAERLSVPGWRWARRYRAVHAPQRYVALYETRAPQDLLCPAYAQMLASPTPRTLAVMPHFRDMTRMIGSMVFKHELGVAGMAAVLFIVAEDVREEQARALGERALRAGGDGREPEAVRVILAQPDSIGRDTPESRLRPGGDRSAPAALVVEWPRASVDDLNALRADLSRDGWVLETERGGLFQLLCARIKSEAA